MANNVLGGFFSTLSNKAHDRAKEERDKQDKSRAEEIGVWKSVLENPASSDEQRQKAVDTLNKLYNWKGKGDSPFQRLAGFMKHVGQSLQQKQQGQQAGKEKENVIEGQPESFPKTGDANAVPKPVMSDIGPAKANIGKKVLGKVASGLGAGMGVVADAFNPHPKALPPLDASAIPSGAQEDKYRLDSLGKELAIRNKYALEQIKERGEEQLKVAKARVANAQNSKIKIPGNAIIGSFPKDQQSNLVDESGLPIDPNGVYAPTDGTALGIENVGGQPTLHAVRVGNGPARESDYGTWMIDTTKSPPELVEVPTHRKSATPAPPQAMTKTTGEPAKAGERPATLPDIKAGTKGEAPRAAVGGDKYHRAPSGFVRPQQFNTLQKQATATDEARNSLIGDDPNQTAGLMADLNIYDNPKSLERVRNYLGFIEKNIGSTAVGSGQGFMAGAEWMVGMPQAINDLQQKGLQQYAEQLTPEEQRFVSDYFRVMGTIGGMRASTGAPAAKWSFQTLFNELPTPGVVTSKDDATRRINNLIQETNVVAKRNPLSQKINIKQNNQDNLSPETQQILKKYKVIK